MIAMLEYERERIIGVMEEAIRSHAALTRMDACTWHDAAGRLCITAECAYIDGTEESTTWKESGDAAED